MAFVALVMALCHFFTSPHDLGKVAEEKMKRSFKQLFFHSFYSSGGGDGRAAGAMGFEVPSHGEAHISGCDGALRAHDVDYDGFWGRARHRSTVLTVFHLA